MNLPMLDLKLLSVKNAHGVDVYLLYTCNRGRHSPVSPTHPVVTLWEPPLLVLNIPESL